MYTVYGKVRTRAFRVLWMLEELGEAYTLEPADPRSDTVRALNPSGKVPVLMVDGDCLTDSTAIITYLADRHGMFTAPSGSIARGQQDGLMHFALDELDAILWTAARHTFILPEEQRVPAVKDSLKWEFERSLGLLETRMGAEFITGDQFSIVDIVTTHCLNWAGNAAFPVTPKMADYAARMRARPAFGRAAAL